ncbi:hypothetical protein [Nocardiopsis prasina]|uniref:hypothetical protein n=1 Tax=Nocardiopsis prasina TaxID=2015 RepID=UPI00034C9AB6|nr:hypothetical protein [Nocardiopsis prasina]
MVRRNDKAGSRPGGPKGPTRPRGWGEWRGAGTRLGAPAALTLALAVSLPTAFAAPAAGHTAAEAVRVETPVASSADDAVNQPEATAFSRRHYYSTWRDARTYWSQESRYPTGGWLWAGRHYFFCQVEGEPHSDGEDGYSTWWALTDDDTGNRDVFVSATAFSNSEPWKPIEGLPRC